MKKITNNNKGFSLIELIIVIAIMAVLVAIIAPNLTKHLGSSKQKTDDKNLDEIASQLQTCITDFETSNGTLGAQSFTWSASGCNCSNSTFAGLVDAAIDSSKAVSKVNGNYAKATISVNAGGGYSISVTF